MTRDKALELLALVNGGEAVIAGPGGSVFVQREIAAEAIIAADQQARDRALEEARLKAAAWKRADAIKLAVGEMTAQELRTAQAVAGGIERAIDALKSTPSAGEDG